MPFESDKLTTVRSMALRFMPSNGPDPASGKPDPAAMRESLLHALIRRDGVFESMAWRRR